MPGGITLRVAVLHDLEQWHGADLCDFAQVAEFTVSRSSSLNDFHPTAEAAFGIPASRQRYWICRRRVNRTIRPDEVILADSRPLESFLSQQATTLLFFLEPSRAPEGVREEDAADLFPQHTEEDRLIFFKLYDPQEQSLRFVTFMVVKQDDTIGSIVPHLNRVLGFSPDQELIFFEEVKPAMVDQCRPTQTFADAELVDGDIICVQKAPISSSSSSSARPLAPDHYRWLISSASS